RELTRTNDPAPVVAVGRVSGEETQGYRGNELREPDESEIERAVREIVHLPTDRDALHLKGEHRRDARSERQPKIEVSERGARMDGLFRGRWSVSGGGVAIFQGFANVSARNDSRGASCAGVK